MIIGLMANVQIVASVFVFKHPDVVNFATWATVAGTLTGFYHYVIFRDQKETDANH